MEPTRVYGKWSAEFLERRMEQHCRAQRHTENLLLAEVIDEIQSLPKRESRRGMLLEFPTERAGLTQ